jgi:hypothetical protein
MRANSESVASAPGRDSVRISSKDEFADVHTPLPRKHPVTDGTQGVYILDLNHMPVGCGTVSFEPFHRALCSLIFVVAGVLDSRREWLALRWRDRRY